MPEGDSIHRAATILRPLLVGQLLIRVVIAGAHHARLDGLAVSAVTATGKHLTIDLASGEWQLRIHLGMNGRWRRYPAATAAPAGASLLLTTPTSTFACLHARTVELTARRDPRRGRAISTLGPDILAPGFDPAIAAARAHARGPIPIGEVLLDQRVTAGIGNIYKSESLWLEHLSPFIPAGSLPLDVLTSLYTRASSLMHASLRGTRARHHIYRLAGRPCPRCRARIATARQGEQLRTTYYCPTCQAPVAAPRLD